MPTSDVTPIDQRKKLMAFYPLLSVLLFLPWLLKVYWPREHGFDVSNYQIGRDFINIWSAPQLAFSGRISTLFDLEAYKAAIGTLFGAPLPFHNWSYPPHSLLLLWPFSLTPYFISLALWTVITFACFLGVIFRFVAGSDRLLASACLLAAPACLMNAVSGQNGFATAALLLGGIALLEQRPIVSGILFGILTAKPQLGVVLPFALLFLGAWRTIAAAIVTTIVLVSASILLFGIDAWQQYIATTLPYQSLLLEKFDGFYTVMMVSVFAAARTLGAPHFVCMALQAVVAVPVLGLTCWAVKRTRDPGERALILTSASLLVSPYVFDYDMVAFTGALAWRLLNARQRTFRSMLAVTAAWLFPFASMSLSYYNLLIAPLAVLGVFLVVISELRGSDLRGSGEPRGLAGEVA